VSQVADDALLMTDQFAGHPAFANYRRIVLAADDAYAANVLWVNGRVVMPAGYSRVAELLAAAGLPPLQLDVSEARKMDGGLTCMSLRF
ncbi:MAG: amidinotransferase, partial [Gammaproteobacteria bacterium]|nr:amidinotransferase [Gammaproteobacteria bacterium]